MQSIINEIIKNQTHCFFISPHLDDAVLSAGSVMSYLAGKTPLTIINIFTQAGGKPYTRSVKGFLKSCGVNDAKELFELRRKEEQQVIRQLGIDSINLGFIDGGFRKRRKKNRILDVIGSKIPEIHHLYPLGRKILKLAKEDEALAKEIKQSLAQCVKDKTNYVVFCPWGKVAHMDHVITRNVCLEIFTNIIFWTDYPYIKNSRIRLCLKNNTLRKFVWDKNMEEKKKLISFYKTQLFSLFPDGVIRVIPEMYWIN